MKTMFYLAMTGQELSQYPHPGHLAYMACHFSPYGQGLTDLPYQLAADSMIILNDRIPYYHHDAEWIARQLADLPCESILLDLQRIDSDCAKKLIEAILSHVTVCVAVTEKYAFDLPCPVLLATADADQDPFTAARKYSGRELWLDLSPGKICWKVNAQGSEKIYECIHTNSVLHADNRLLCHYSIHAEDEEVIFSLHRSFQDVHRLLDRGHSLGITRGIGLYQEWQRFIPEFGS